MDILWILLAATAGFLAGAAGIYLGSSLLRRAVRELQYGLADLEDRLVREVKKRAAAARWEPGGDDQVDPAAAVAELKGFLSPLDFVKKKWGGRRGSQPQ